MEALVPLAAGLGTGLALIVAIGVQNTYLLRLAVSSGLRVVTAAVVVCAVSDAVLILAGVLGVGVVVERFPVAIVVIRFIGAAFLLTYGVLAARRALRPPGDTLRIDTASSGAVAVDGLDTGTEDRGSAVTLAPHGGQHAAADEGAMSVEGHDPTSRSPAAAPTAALPDATLLDPEPARPTRAAPPGRSEVTTRAAVVTMLAFTWANPHVYLDTLVFLGSVGNQQGVDDRWWWTTGAIAASCLWFGALGFGGRLLRPLFAKPLTWRMFDGLVAAVMLGFGCALALGA